MPPARMVLHAAQRHALIQHDVIADLSGLADHDAGAMLR